MNIGTERTEVDALRDEVDALRRIVRDLHWMARRYCDGRISTVASTFNEHTRALLGLEVASEIERTARLVIDKALSVRATEALVKKQRSPAKNEKAKRTPVQKSASVRDLEERLTKALGGPVTITEEEPGKAGRIEIKYLNLDHLDRLLDRLL